ncbi:hypothetical protein FS749_005850 [Ceratobasidium sp. UAMH 11750]|nr:hypothetical protein FS749_005850 [Ceratobasidium sp. UAMH 11750]
MLNQFEIVIGRGVAPQTPYPVAWPDFRMAGRPALPPQHPIWVQERANLKDWFRYLWLWQGGSESPNWNLIAEDINEGRFEYIEKSRLPNPFLPFQHIDLWDEETTRAWSTHIRSTMDSWGRVILEKQRGAVQFRKIDDIRGQPSLIYAEFCRVPPPLSSLDWLLSSMRFEKRVRQAIGELARPTAHDLYGHTAPLIELVLPVLPSICELEQALREYEGSNPPEAEPASPEDARTSWHPAALHVHREKPTFYKNSDISECTFPPSFASLMEAGHHQWAVTALRDWLQTNPFWNEQAGCLNSGTNGVAVAFFAVAHYAANVSRVTPETDAEVEAMIQQDLHVYGRPELRTLEKCVDILLAQVVASARDQPRGLNLTDSDLEARYLVWQPTRWIERFGDGTVDELSQCSYARPDVNPFEAADVQDKQLHHEDAGREPSILIVSSSESESESESGSIDDESAWTSDDSRTTIRSGHMSGIDDSQNLNNLLLSPRSVIRLTQSATPSVKIADGDQVRTPSQSPEIVELDPSDFKTGLQGKVRGTTSFDSGKGRRVHRGTKRVRDLGGDIEFIGVSLAKKAK